MSPVSVSASVLGDMGDIHEHPQSKEMPQISNLKLIKQKDLRYPYISLNR